MTRTLPFAQSLLNMGRNLQRLGQTHAASRLLRRLASLGDLPEELAEETHLQLAEQYLQRGRLQKARRMLAAALVLAPDNAHYHFLMAGAVEQDDDCDPIRALRHYRRCTKLDPDHAAYWCALGLLSLRLGETAEGLAALRRAQELAPEDYEILSQVALGLREEGEWAEAKKLLRKALFRNPRDPRFRALWTSHQFQLLHSEQRKAEKCGRFSGQRGPVILPFSPPDANLQSGGKCVRRDLPSGTPGPILPLRKRRKIDDRRHTTGDGRR